MTAGIVPINNAARIAKASANRKSLIEYESSHKELISETVKKGQAFYIFVVNGTAFGAICPIRSGQELDGNYLSIMRQRMETVHETRDPGALMSAFYRPEE